MATSGFVRWALIALGLIVAPLVWRSGQSLTVLSQMGIAIIACLSFNLLLGQGGMLSFGHASYTGAGAFMAIYALNGFAAAQVHLPVPLVPLAGGLAGLALAALLGWFCTRRAGTSFAMITLGMGELIYAVSVMLPQWFGGEAGLSANRAAGPALWGLSFGPPLQIYYLIAAYTLASVALVYAFTLTPLGRLLNAVRDNPQRVKFIGYNPQRVRYQAFVISGFFAGVAGALAALNFETVNSEAFSATRSGAYLLFTFVGGTGYFMGPILGGVAMVLASVVLSGFTQAWSLYLGLLFMAMVVWLPGGLASALHALVQRVRQGQALVCLGLAARLAPGTLLGAAGASALVEMLYHRQLGAAVGASLAFGGLTLDTASPSVWASALLLCAGGTALFVWQLRYCRAVWAHGLKVLHAP